MSEEELKRLRSEAEKYHTEGFSARKQGDYDRAIDLYTQALKILPVHFKALFNRGFAFDKIGKFDLAIEDYSKAT